MSLVKKLRNENNLKMSDMAELLQISVPNYQKKETGKVKFTLTEARKISIKFDKSIEEIFFADEVS